MIHEVQRPSRGHASQRERSLIVTEDLHKRYGDVDALCGVTLTVAEGELFGLIGLNGAGKSTLLRTLLGLIRPTRGRAAIGGMDCWTNHIQAARIARGALDSEGLYAHLTALEHMDYLSQTWRYALSRGQHVSLLARVGLADVGARRVATLSTGMRRRLHIALALMGDPRVLLLDEPTSGLDPQGIIELHTVLHHLHRDGLTILISSHSLAELAHLCTRLGVLHRGQLMATGTTADLVALAGRTYELSTTDVSMAQTVVTRRARNTIARPATRASHLRLTGADDIDEIVSALSVAGLVRGRPEHRETDLADAFLHITRDRRGLSA